MTQSMPSRHVAEVLTTLSGERWPVAWARTHMRPVPGLYAIYGDAKAWADLRLDPQPGSALYVGKSEDNLVRRELDTHFAADPTKKPRTGSSTVRRSFAALLRDDALDLHAVPRNPDKPGHFSNFGLTPGGDAQLTAWMHERLSLAVWERPAWLAQLVEVEAAVIHCWMPPLNITHNPRPLPRLRLAREAMTREAAGSQAGAGSTSAAPAYLRPTRESAPVPDAGARGLTPVELACELGKSPKTIRQALRAKYGRLPSDGARWGALTPEQEYYLRARFR